MLKHIGMIALGIFLVLCGLGMIEMGVQEPTYELASRVFSGICGAIMAAGGGVITYLYVSEARRYGMFRGFLPGLLREVIPEITVVTADGSDMERLLRDFRRDLADFLGETGVRENAQIQNDTTQIFLHILTLQKRRLDAKRIVSRTEAERVMYEGMPAVRKKMFFDGKYRITDAAETLELHQTFSRAGDKKPLYTKNAYETAHYRLLSAERKGGDIVICPNCGSRSTRENLLDGCDYCGTRFSVEDLGTRVSQFSLRPDYEAEYARFTEVRETYVKRVGLLIGIPVFLLCLYGAMQASWDYEGMFILRIAATIFAVAFPTAAVVFFGEILFFLFVFPFLQAGASFRYIRGRRKAIRREQERDSSQEKLVRRNDPLFSLQGFYSWVENILAAIHYGEDLGASAFTESKQADDRIGACLKKYRDVIDMEVAEIRLDDYKSGPQMQEAVVSAELQLLQEKDGRVRRKREKVRLHLVKSAACRTQAVCGPSFLRCRNCGASLSLQEGKICPHCGTERKLYEQEWAVRDYKVV